MPSHALTTDIGDWLGKEVRISAAPAGKTLLVISAHPDDIESECAGTLALAADSGCDIHAVVATSGGNRARELEALAAGAVLGLTGVDFLGYTDGEVINNLDLRRDLVSAIRRLRPDIVLTYDPEFTLPLYISHPDHRAVGRAAIDAVYPLARDGGTFPELAAESLKPHKVLSLWLFASAYANTYVDIAAALERKVSARLKHTSQTPNPDTLRLNWEHRANQTGQRASLAAAEAFTVITLEEGLQRPPHRG